MDDDKANLNQDNDQKPKKETNSEEDRTFAQGFVDGVIESVLNPIKMPLRILLSFFR